MTVDFMFTGIVQGLGQITNINGLGGESRLSITPLFEWTEPLTLGESIAVSGACLTVTTIDGASFTADVSAETLSRTAIGHYKTGEKVNLERSLRLSDRLGGHLVLGHVDDLGRVKEIRTQDRSKVFTFSLNPKLTAYVIEKGSVAVDGVSLTVNQVLTDGFTVNIIPHTSHNTTLAFKSPGDYVNLETDLIGKYVARLMGLAPQGSEIDTRFLAEHGFL